MRFRRNSSLGLFSVALSLLSAMAACGGQADSDTVDFPDATTTTDAGMSETSSDGSVHPDSTTSSDSTTLADSGPGTDSSVQDSAGSDSAVTSEFSFFVISLSAIKEAGGEEGLGGNLGGLAGADALCQKAAEKVGSTDKLWRAFLSVTNDGTGKAVNAIDRIGTGPWYNVKGLLMAQNIAGLLQLRPAGSTEIVYTNGPKSWPFNQCLTDEFGACVLSYGDSHDILTGTGQDGKLFSTDKRYTCNDWTSSESSGKPAIGHAWPRQLNSTGPGEAHWIQTTNHFPNGCGRNINLSNTMEPGVGGDGGYGGFYCFAVTGN